MDDLHIIFEAPEAYSVPSKQQSPSSLATACEYCREKKIKCQIKSSSPICLACSTSNRACRSPNRSTTAQISAFSTADMTPGLTNDAHCDFTLQMCFKDVAQGSPLLDLSIPSVSGVEWSPSSSRSPTAVPTELSELAKTPQVSDCRSTISQRFADEYSYTDSDISTMSDPSPRLHNHSVDHRLVSSSRPSLSDLIFDPVRPPFPSFEYMQEGMQLFFDNLGSHFPFLHRERVYRSMNDMSLPAALANCIVGLAMRFSIAGGPETSRYLLGEPFIEMAKEIIMPVVHIPSLETLHALILLAWCEYGQAREKDLPVFRQYAVSMALSIGVGTDTLLFGASREEQVDFRSTWWSIVTIDLLVSWATGTSTMLSPENYCPARIPALRPAEFLNTLLHEHLYDLLALRNRLLSTIHSNIVLGHERNHADNFR
ncbi:hypothetical protein BD410DRAFT_588230 [Rickenella mellea]|uniref:Zn(2)-C6 fungal-type domain-containing protein n=1 Tax=Rickenella mellea TaxID=50990 RepID=A0A4Y7PNA2_9AGAM|nr:hypothetical protein BD410DRAFT_588230 [Rickenella mellea]